MGVMGYGDLISHVGHKVVVVTYGEEGEIPVNVAIECEDCKEVLLDYDFHGYCLECDKAKEYETDIQLCENCMLNYDMDKLWKMHDNKELDALDFNENPQLREFFRKV